MFHDLICDLSWWMFHMNLRRMHVLLLLGEGMSKWQLYPVGWWWWVHLCLYWYSACWICLFLIEGFCFVYFVILILGAYEFRTTISSWWIDPFTSMRGPSVSLAMLFSIESIVLGIKRLPSLLWWAYSVLVVFESGGRNPSERTAWALGRLPVRCWHMGWGWCGL